MQIFFKMLILVALCVYLNLQIQGCILVIQSVRSDLHFVSYNAGTVNGCAWQKIGGIINLGSCYLVRIPLATF